MCGHVRPLLAELLATALFLTLASLGPGPKAISWGVSYALSTLLAGPQAVLNPALSLAMVASRQVNHPIIIKEETKLEQKILES